MTSPEPLPSWLRRHFQPGGGDAHLFYKIHGRFSEPPAVSRSRYRTDGVPAGCDLQSFSREHHADVLGIGLDGYIGRTFREEAPALFDAVSSTDQCLVLQGVVQDPPTLDYFRDAVGMITALLDSGGVAVFDPHMFKWWSAQEWRELAFEPAGAVPRHHAVILVSEEEDGGHWYHTRGMLKFGRPDISVHNVTAELEPAVQDLCDRFIEMQAFGAVIPEGQPIKMAGLPAGWRCSHGGDLDDPEFNNRHIEVGP
jgi:hypothetical protein